MTEDFWGIGGGEREAKDVENGLGVELAGSHWRAGKIVGVDKDGRSFRGRSWRRGWLLLHSSGEGADLHVSSLEILQTRPDWRSKADCCSIDGSRSV